MRSPSNVIVKLRDERQGHLLGAASLDVLGYLRALERSGFASPVLLRRHSHLVISIIVKLIFPVVGFGTGLITGLVVPGIWSMPILGSRLLPLRPLIRSGII